MKPKFLLSISLVLLLALLVYVHFFNSVPWFRFLAIYISEIPHALLLNIPYDVYGWYTQYRYEYVCGLPKCLTKVERCDVANGSDTYVYKILGRGSSGWSLEYFDKNGKSICSLYSGLCIQDGCDERFKECPKVSSCSLVLGTYFRLPFESE